MHSYWNIQHAAHQHILWIETIIKYKPVKCTTSYSSVMKSVMSSQFPSNILDRNLFCYRRYPLSGWQIRLWGTSKQNHDTYAINQGMQKNAAKTPDPPQKILNNVTGIHILVLSLRTRLTLNVTLFWLKWSETAVDMVMPEYDFIRVNTGVLLCM